MNSAKNQFESGQVLIIIVFGIVVFLGFAALAIDLGMVWSDRRHAQNTADTSSLAGARAAADYLEDNRVRKENFSCSKLSTVKSVIIKAAVSRSADNGIDGVDSNSSDGHGVDVICEDDDDTYIDIKTTLTVDTQTTFSHMIFSGPLRNTVVSIARVYPTRPLFDGFAIVALNNSNCKGQQGVSFGGDADVKITGGGVFSNGCLDGDGNSFSVKVVDGDVLYGDAGNNLGNISPSPSSGDGETDSYVQLPDCSVLTAKPKPGNSGDYELEPGIYSSIKSTGGHLKFKPGLYCLTSSTFALDISANTEVEGLAVTFYVPNGSVKINGGESVELYAASGGDTAAIKKGAVPNLLFYVAQGDFDSSGNNESRYLGTIYVPNGDVSLTGTGDTGPTFNTQIIGYNVKVAGTANIDINFNNDENYQEPPSLDLQK